MNHYIFSLFPLKVRAALATPITPLTTGTDVTLLMQDARFDSRHDAKKGSAFALRLLFSLSCCIVIETKIY